MSPGAGRPAPRRSDFAAVARSLRAGINSHWAASGEKPDAARASTTLDINSVLVEQRTAALLEPLVGPLRPDALAGLQVIDLGCGYGAMSLLLAQLGASVTGIDRHPERLEVARTTAERHDLDARFVPARMERLAGDDDERYDLAVANNSLCYLVEPLARTAALAEARRVLRPGGRLVVRDPNRAAPRDPFTGLPLVHLLPPNAATATAARMGRARSAVRLRGPRAAQAELRRAGFVEVALLPVRPGWRGRIAGYQHVTGLRAARPRACARRG